MRTKTQNVRVPKDICDELKLKFPGVPLSSLFTTAYHTSALKWEAKLRKNVKKK